MNNDIGNLEVMTQKEHAKISVEANSALLEGRKKRWPKK